MTDGQEINKLKLEVAALKQQLHTDRENAQVKILRLEKRIGELATINEEHKKINGDLRQLNNELIKDSENLQEKLSKYEDKAAHYRRKAVL